MIRRTSSIGRLRHAALLAALGALVACSENDNSSLSGSTVDTGNSGQDGAVSADSSADGGADATAPTGLGWVYASDPVTDNNKTTQVTLPPITSTDGSLTGEYAQVHNCLQKDGGQPIEQSGFEIGSLCVEEATAFRQEDGNWLGYNAPANTSDPGDPFAEVQMYYHMHQMHDFFKNDFGLTDLDFPLYGLVNVTLNVPFQGGWTGFPNAAFMPAEAFAQLGLPERENGAIVFGQYDDLDFSYDASVIYHEYTHAMVGTTRLLGSLVDLTGLDNLPGAMNEGFADYFSASHRNEPVIGAYALTAFPGQNLDRDLTQFKKCPDDLTTEVHADGKIVGSTLWELRQALTQPVADAIILKALQSFTQSTNLEIAGKLIVAEAKKVGEEARSTTNDILKKHGFIGCTRAKEWVAFSANQSEEGLPYAVESKDSLQGGGGSSFPDGLPGYLQFFVDVPTNAKTIKLRWRVEQNQQGGFGGGGTVKLGIAVKRDQAVYLQGVGSTDADDKAEPAIASGWQEVAVTGKCLQTDNGRLYAMFLNKNASAAISNMAIEFPADTTGITTVLDCE